jgi:hypothetical protein
MAPAVDLFEGNASICCEEFLSEKKRGKNEFCCAKKNDSVKVVTIPIAPSGSQFQDKYVSRTRASYREDLALVQRHLVNLQYTNLPFCLLVFSCQQVFD